MKKIILLLIAFIYIQLSHSQEETILEITPEQSMLITGKGQGQDAAINPYKDIDSYAVVSNIGKNNFEVRVQSKGKIIEMITIAPNEKRKIDLSLGYELYLDTDANGTAKVNFVPKL